MSYAPRLLRINLSAGSQREESVPARVTREYVGGRGLGIKYLYDEMKPGVDPMSSESKLIMVAGPLAGTGALSSSRWMAIGKSPLTNTYFRSVAGGDFGAWMKWSGFEIIIIEGRASVPAYIWLKDGKAEIIEARHLWGQTTSETQRLLTERHGHNARIACVGPAGENLVRFAGIFTGSRSASRGGMGAVMGFKNLKAIVIDSARRVELPDQDTFKAIVKEQGNTITTNRGFPHLSQNGTNYGQDHNNRKGIFPTRNFQWGSLQGWEKFCGDEFVKLRGTEHISCYACPIHCGKKYTVKDGPYAGVSADGPEYETIWAFTGPICSTDIGAPIYANYLCDTLGIDAITMGSVLGFSYELYEREIITGKDTDGLALVWGKYKEALDLIPKTVYRRGFGDILADGVMKASLRIGRGAANYAMHIKGLEIPAYDPRGVKRMGLSYAVSSTGASASDGYSMQDIYGFKYPRATDRFAELGYADVVKYNQDFMAAIDTGILCVFPCLYGMITIPTFARMMASATGIREFGDPEYLFQAGRRIYMLERAFNLREGFGRKDDRFPARLTGEPLKNAGPAEGQLIKAPGAMLDEYYALTGLDADGCPTQETLEKLGLGWIGNERKRT